MKRKLLSLILSVVLLAFCLPATAVSAEEDLSGGASLTVGDEGWWTLFEVSESVDSVKLISGTLPAGFELGKTETTVYITGAATVAGTYECTIEVGFNSGKTLEYAATILIAAKPVVKITKHPIGEIVIEGDRTYFTASAENYTSAVWQLVSEDGKTVVDADKLEEKFPGLKVDLSKNEKGQEQMNLSKIPMEMDGWDVRVKFVGTDGIDVYTDSVWLVVEKFKVQDPRISTQPRGGSFTVGNPVQLTVQAESPDEGELIYQWYSTSSGNIATIRAIDGAESASFSVPSNEGQMYYCVGVWNKKMDQVSDPVYSDLVAVSFVSPTVATTAPTQPTAAQPDTKPVTTPTQAAAEVPAQPQAPADHPAPATEPVTAPQPEKKSSPLSYILVAIAGAAIAAGIFFAVVKINTAAQPAVYYRCHICGWRSRKGQRRPRICPRCGAEITAADRHRAGTYRK